MCGIVGIIGNNEGNKIVLNGLQRMEYRGYDSCGIAYAKDEKIKIVKSINRISSLKDMVNDKSDISIGHTRWATHGGVNLENSHPHVTSDKKMVMVHNGVVENYQELAKKYCKDIDLKSETDTEIILETLNYFYSQEKDMKKALVKFIEVVEGSYASIVYNLDNPDDMIVIKNKSPMLIGKGESFYTVSSDPTAVLDQTNNFYQIEDKKFAIINKKNNDVQLYDKKGEEEEIKFEVIDMDFEEITTEDYDTFMLKEIEEQPKVLLNIVENYKNINIDEKLKNEMKNASKIYIVASGTSYHSGLIVKSMIEEKLKIPVEPVLGSEFGYNNNLIADGSFFIFLSQSGETADSMLVFNKIKGKYPILAVTNVRGSQMDRNADYSLQIFAGMEVAVASTKAYTAQIAVMSVLINEIVGNKKIYEELEKVIEAQKKIIKKRDEIYNISKKMKKFKEIFYLGRLQDYYICQEAALKIKEITYINVSAFPGGELKHGTISLIDNSKLCVFVIDDENIAANTRSGLEEVKARDGQVIIFSNSKTKRDGDDFVIEYDGASYLDALVSILPHQYLSYYIAKDLGLDVDKPRNLAKAVTVE